MSPPLRLIHARKIVINRERRVARRMVSESHMQAAIDKAVAAVDVIEVIPNPSNKSFFYRLSNGRLIDESKF